jgi:diaminopimelate epimerase
VDRAITVHMPGGAINIDIGQDFFIQMTGSVTKVGEGNLHTEIFSVKA